MMRKLLLGILGLAAVASAPASAADLAARPYYSKTLPPMIAAVYDWSGFYIGANGGGGWSHKCWTNTTNVLGVVTNNEGCHDASGGIVGGQIGYRWQAGSWVFGLEGQGDWANLRGSNVSLFNNVRTDQSKINGLGLITGQIGYAFNNVLWYVKGGGAVTGDRYTGFTTATGVVVDTASETRWGGTVGTGLEFAFTPNWSVAVEYDHLFMGTRNLTLVAPGVVVSRVDSIKQDVDMATVRVNYRWGGPVIAKY